MGFGKLKQEIEVALQQGALERAGQLLKQGEVELAEDSDFYSLQAVYFYLKGDLESAKASINKGLSITRFHYELHYNLYQICMASCEYTNALKSYLEAYLIKIESKNNMIEMSVEEVFRDISTRINNLDISEDERQQRRSEISQILIEFNERIKKEVIKFFLQKMHKGICFITMIGLKEIKKSILLQVTINQGI